MADRSHLAPVMASPNSLFYSKKTNSLSKAMHAKVLTWSTQQFLHLWGFLETYITPPVVSPMGTTRLSTQIAFEQVGTTLMHSS
jgi:hypothetical protein